MPEVVIEEIRPDLFRVEVPLPRNPLKATNSYIIKCDRRNLVIDTGMNREECKTALMAAFEELEIDLGRTDYFVTHVHADHIGLVDDLSTNGSAIYFNRPDAEVFNYKNIWQFINTLTSKHGFPADEVDKAIDSHPGQRYSPKNPVDFTFIEDGEVIIYGDYKLKCVITPGHTRGHTCLYEPERKFFFSGDHILGDITPNISTWLDDSNPLKEYFKSLDRVAEMDIDLVLPGHRSKISDCKGRIAALKEHHRLRLEEVQSILGGGVEMYALEVASKMTWDLVAASWDDYPLMQKWFATGEALAHIRFLEVEGRVKRRMKGNTLYFSAE